MLLLHYTTLRYECTYAGKSSSPNRFLFPLAFVYVKTFKYRNKLPYVGVIEVCRIIACLDPLHGMKQTIFHLFIMLRYLNNVSGVKLCVDAGYREMVWNANGRMRDKSRGGK